MRCYWLSLVGNVEALLGRLLIERTLYRNRYERLRTALINAARAGLLDSDVVAALAMGSERVFDALVDAGLRESGE